MAQQSNVPPQLLADYQATIELIKLLTDIRFRLLALVPAISGFAVAFLGHTSDDTVALSIGVLGFAVTLGIIMYDLRNSQIYNLATHRAKWIEYVLDMPRLTPLEWQKPDKEGMYDKDKYHGGLITERPFRLYWLFNRKKLRAKHDRALGLIYGASLGGWAYLIFLSLLRLVLSIFVDITKHMVAQFGVALISLLLAMLVARAFAGELVRLDELENPDELPPGRVLPRDVNAAELPQPPPRDAAELKELRGLYFRASPIVAQPSTDGAVGSAASPNSSVF